MARNFAIDFNINPFALCRAEWLSVTTLGAMVLIDVLSKFWMVLEHLRPTGQ
jgi:hypothetical protein